MTATPALVLATLATLGACPVGCPAPSPADATNPVDPVDPHAPTQPELEPGSLPPVNPGGDVVDPDVEPLGVLDALTTTRLPGSSDRLTVPTADPSPAPGASLDPGAVQEADEADAGDTAVPTAHVHPDQRTGPTSQGEAVHAAPSDSRSLGRAVSAESAAVTASVLAGLAAAGLYHKLSKKEALEHPARERILAMLDEDPGLGTTDVADDLDVCYRTARHHLEVLARFDLVVRSKQRGACRWARPGDAQAVRQPEVPETQRRVLDLLDEEPGLHLSAIARRLDLAKATVKLHLDRLSEDGRIVEEEVGPLRRFEPAGETARDPA